MTTEYDLQQKPNTVLARNIKCNHMFMFNDVIMYNLPYARALFYPDYRNCPKTLLRYKQYQEFYLGDGHKVKHLEAVLYVGQVRVGEYATNEGFKIIQRWVETTRIKDISFNEMVMRNREIYMSAGGGTLTNVETGDITYMDESSFVSRLSLDFFQDDKYIGRYESKT